MSGEADGIDLDAIKARAAAATPGPWRIEGAGIWGGRGFYGEVVTPDRVECSAYCYGGSSTIAWEDADQEFIAAARSDVPALVAEVERLRAERDAALARIRAVEELFAGGPDTSCRTIWQAGIECVSVPIADLHAALAAPTEDSDQ